MILDLDGDYYMDVMEIAEPVLEGRWLLDRSGEVWEFGSDKAGNTILEINGTAEITVTFIEYDFGRILLTYDESLAEESRSLSMPLTGLFLVMKDAEEMTLMEIDPAWLERLSMEDPEESWSRKFGDRIFITSTGSVDRLLREHGDDPDAFRRFGVLRPLKSSQQ
jgi:hypothetical protein